MKKLTKELLFVIISIGLIIILNLFFPLSVTYDGVSAWFVTFVLYFLGFAFLYTAILGGIISVESEGLIPTIKRWRNRNK